MLELVDNTVLDTVALGRGSSSLPSRTKLVDVYKVGLKENVCEWCGVTEWYNKPLVNQLDHIDGCSTNHLYDNLRILCPNCHSQTDTYCGRNKKDDI